MGDSIQFRKVAPALFVLSRVRRGEAPEPGKAAPAARHAPQHSGGSGSSRARESSAGYSSRSGAEESSAGAAASSGGARREPGSAAQRHDAGKEQGSGEQAGPGEHGRRLVEGHAPAFAAATDRSSMEGGEEKEEEEWEMEEEEEVEEEDEDEESAVAADGSVAAGEGQLPASETGGAAPAWLWGAGAQGTQATARAAAAAALSSGSWTAVATENCCKSRARKFYVPGQCRIPSHLHIAQPCPFAQKHLVSCAAKPVVGVAGSPDQRYCSAFLHAGSLVGSFFPPIGQLFLLRDGGSMEAPPEGGSRGRCWSWSCALSTAKRSRGGGGGAQFAVSMGRSR